MSMLMSRINRHLISLSLLLWLTACSSMGTAPDKDKSSLTSTAENTDAALADAERALYAQALADLQANRFAPAEAAFTRLAEQHPKLAGPWANLGLIYIKQDQLDRAADMLMRALENQPDLAQAKQLLGYIENKRGHYLKARDLYLEALAAKPDYAVAHYNLALLYDIYLRDIPKAIEHYTRYLALAGREDKRTADWVNELTSSLKRDEQ